jgi:hypothetical protein
MVKRGTSVAVVWHGSVAMLTAGTILAELTAIANDWWPLAAGWHVALAMFIFVLACGWRPRVRTAGWLLITPLLSVSLLAWLSANPFNGIVAAALAVALARSVFGLPAGAVRLASPAWIARGAALVVFGAVYPHFLRADSPAAYLVASPFGLLPCPTLSVLVGATLVFANLGSTRWSGALAAAGLLYGSIGVFALGVELDWGLMIGTATLGARMAEPRDSPRRGGNFAAAA